MSERLTPVGGKVPMTHACVLTEALNAHFSPNGCHTAAGRDGTLRQRCVLSQCMFTNGFYIRRI